MHTILKGWSLPLGGDLDWGRPVVEELCEECDKGFDSGVAAATRAY